MQVEAARLEPVMDAIAQLRHEFDVLAQQQQQQQQLCTQQQQEQQQLWAQQQKCMQQSMANKVHDAADAGPHSCITFSEAADLRAQIAHLASQLVPLKAEVAESREKAETAEVHATAAEAAARQAAESIRRAEAAEARAAAAEAAAREAAEVVAAAEAAAREAAEVATAVEERLEQSETETGAASAALPVSADQLAGLEAKMQEALAVAQRAEEASAAAPASAGQLAALEMQTQKALTLAHKAEAAVAASPGARLHTDAAAARKEGGGAAAAAGVEGAHGTQVQQHAAGALQKADREAAEAAASDMAAQFAALARELEELGVRLASAERRIGRTEAASAESVSLETPLEGSGVTTSLASAHKGAHIGYSRMHKRAASRTLAVGAVPQQRLAADGICGDEARELYGGLGQELMQESEPAGTALCAGAAGTQCMMGNAEDATIADGAGGMGEAVLGLPVDHGASVAAEEGLAEMRAMRGMIKDLQAGQAQLARDVEAATADS
ncbi:hypothetical protein DUNSADRAFT_2840, partial [Dunaliella salina]